MKGPDYNASSIRNRNLEVLAAAVRLGILKIPRQWARNVQSKGRKASAKRLASGLSQRQVDKFIAELPSSLCQAEAIQERLAFRKASKRFERYLKDGHRVLFGTVVHPAWAVPIGQLTPDHFNRVKQHVLRRARTLTRHGHWRLLGTVDISLNEDAAVGGGCYWQPHAHFLLVIKAPEKYDVQKVATDAFRPNRPPLTPGTSPVDFPLCRGVDGIRRSREYTSSKLLALRDQQRNSYFDDRMHRQTRDVRMPLDRYDELIAVLDQLGPRSRWILGGIRREGDGFRVLKQSSRRKRDHRYYIKSMYRNIVSEDDSYYLK
jgi:hypothetical protein